MKPKNRLGIYMIPDTTLSPQEHAHRAVRLTTLAYLSDDVETREYVLSLARAHTRLSEGDAA